jgi:DNA polymerase II large subunit
MLTEKTQKYFENFEKEVRKTYAFAEEAKKTGLDPVNTVEVPLAMTMASKVVSLIATIYPQMEGCGIDERILSLEEKYGKLDVTIVFKIAEEVSKQKFCKFSSLLEAMDAGIRIGFAYITLGVVSSPIEGFTGLKVRKTKGDKEYLEASFSGPIRSAGTTASCVVLMLIDYLREIFGFEKYDPSEEEIKRVVAEISDFHERITNLQYMPTEEEIIFLAKNMPIQVAGDASEKLEVSNYKNLERVETNYLRSGFCLIMAEGLAQKAAKGFRLLNQAKKNGIVSTGFDFLEEYVELHEKRNVGKVEGPPTYIKDLVAGRPVYGHPGRSGGFRFRYGRGRVSGFSASSLHPATMAISDDFIAIGTQLKIEKPTKGMVATVCDKIEGPTVKLSNGSVRKIKTKEEAKKIYSDVEEIIYLGDLLFPFSDVVNRNAMLIQPGYVEEWWMKELEEKNRAFSKEIDCYNVDFETALNVSEKFGIPLHPEFIFYWTQISKEQFYGLLDWIKCSRINEKIIFPYSKSEREKFSIGKRALELLGVEHEVTLENVVLNVKNSRSLLINLGFDYSLLKEEKLIKDFFDEKKFVSEKSVLETLNSFSKYVIKDRAGEFIGSRMGRPEKAKLRKLAGSPNALFPVGNEGGRLRSVQTACEVGGVKSSFPLFYCEKCEKETIYSLCEICNSKTKKKFYFRESKTTSFKDSLEGEEKKGVPYSFKNLAINDYFRAAVKKLGLKTEEIPPLVKGVRGMSSEGKILENMAKGLLRAKHNLQVNKDGTIRFDATELPLIAFKPKEISVSVEKLKTLGYTHDVNGKELVQENQILELMPHDILLPSSPETPDERGDDVFFRVSKFVDEELERFYGLKSFYNIKSREDLVGHLGVCMAPHNCAGVVCRIIGFSNTLGLLASPYMHAAIRRDCFDYDTSFLIKKDGLWKNVKIGEIVENLKPRRIVDAFGTKEIRVEGFETLGFDKKVKNVKINNFTKHKKQNMFEIKTSLGKKITVTENHKFFIDGKIKQTRNLRLGDKLPLPIRTEIPVRKQRIINLLEEFKTEKIMVRKINCFLKKLDEKEKILKKLNITKKQFLNYQLRDSYPVNFVLELDKNLKEKIYSKGKIAIKRDNVEIPILIRLDTDLLEILGLYVAEGYSRSLEGNKGLNQVYISSFDQKLRVFIKKTIKKHFNLNFSENKNDRVTFSSKILYLFFNKFLGCGENSKNKRIPSLFFDLSLDKLASFLRGYFEGDGSISIGDRRISCDSVSEGLLSDLEFCLNRFGIFCKRYEYEKEPGNILKTFYLKKKRKIPKFKITKLIIGSDFVSNFEKIGFLSPRKNKILKHHLFKKGRGMKIIKDKFFIYDPIVSIKNIGKKESYCLNVETKNHLVVANSILSKQCDGDEAAIMLLMDVLLNFSRKFLPSHRGGTQDAPLVLNAKINAGEVDDQILDFEFVDGPYSLEFYRMAERKEHSGKVSSIKVCKDILKEGKDPFVGLGFTHDTENFNNGVVCSSYKLLATMQDKVNHQMELVEKIRSVDTSDTARLIIERHFIRDMKGNLRKFSQQGFRCVACNESFRRPPLSGVCSNCGGKIIFTIHEGGIKKYLEPALLLAKKYNLSSYIQQNLELLKNAIDSIFGKELEKQEALEKWF